MLKTKNKIIVIGGTIAGMTAALKAVECGASVQVISEVPLRRSDDTLYRDGISAVMDGSVGDALERHISDTILCADFLADQKAVRKMCEQAPYIVRLCDRLGVPFNRTPEGKFSHLRGVGASNARTYHADAATGQQVVYMLDNQVRRLEAQGRLQRFEYMSFSSLVLDDSGTCRGVVAMDIKNMEFKFFTADAVVMCESGYSGLYKSTTASSRSTGASIAQAYIQGADFANPEFIQFCPAAVKAPDKMRTMGEIPFALGASLKVTKNERSWEFIDEKYPSWGLLVPYDLSSREVWNVIHEMKLGVDGEEAVHLDLSGIKEDELNSAASSVLNVFDKLLADDPAAKAMKVAPAAHYTMGGLWVDDEHMTSIPGLFAAGGSDHQYHGASCQGSNIILSAMHGGIVAGASCVEYAGGLEEQSDSIVASVFEKERDKQEGGLKALAEREEGESSYAIGTEMREVMDEHVGIIRSGDNLTRAESKVNDLLERYAKCKPSDRNSWANYDLKYTLDLGKQLELARLIIRAAQGRKESRGAHRRLDCPLRDDMKWGVVTRAEHGSDGPEFNYDQEIDLSEMNPKERVYA